MNWMLKNSKGHIDGAWTLCVISFFVVSVSIFLSMVQGLSLNVGALDLTIKPPDTTLILGYLATTTGNYLMRRNKKDQIDHEQTTKVTNGKEE